MALIGKTLAQYEITDLLGKGGMGEVYRAKDTKLGREVALKRIREARGLDPAALERFQREAETIAALNHPNIVHLYTAEEADGVQFLTMELVEGMDLHELRQSRKLELSEVLQIGIAVADALATAHARGIVHRDLKPGNIMRTTEGRVKVLDFGLAKLVQESEPSQPTQSVTMPLTEESAIVGTLPYMAPEQLSGAEAGARADLFSLGIVLYELLTGRRPFRGMTSSETRAAILRDSPPMPSELEPLLPADIDRILRRCLAKDPRDRYASAADLRDALQELRDNLSSSSSKPAASTSSAGGGHAIARVLAGTALIATIATVFYVSRGEPEAEPIRSLAVLPFANRSGDPEQEYFSDGFTDQLTTTLADVSALTVIARTSAAGYKASGKRVSEIGKELGVSALVTGSVLRSGNHIRITAELVSTKDETTVWAKSYERGVGNALKLQAEVARSVADAVAVELSPADSDRLAAPVEVDPRALDLYLRGRALWSQREKSAMDEGLRLFREAIEIEPEFALAHAGLADSYIVMSVHGYLDPHDAIPQAKEAAERAIQLDPTAGEPHASLGDLYFHYYWDWEASEAALRRAIELSPGFATAHQWLAEPLMVTGRVQEAEDELRAAAALDPYSMIVRTQLALTFEYRDRLDESIQILREAKRLDRRFAITQVALARNLVNAGQFEEALAEARSFIGMNPNYVHGQGVLGLCLARMGRETEARALLDSLESARSEPFMDEIKVARIAVGLEDRDATLRYLRAGVEGHEGTAPFLPGYAEFDFLHEDPEFRELMRTMNLPGW